MGRRPPAAPRPGLARAARTGRAVRGPRTGPGPRAPAHIAEAALRKFLASSSTRTLTSAYVTSTLTLTASSRLTAAKRYVDLDRLVALCRSSQRRSVHFQPDGGLDVVRRRRRQRLRSMIQSTSTITMPSMTGDGSSDAQVDVNRAMRLRPPRSAEPAG